MSKTIDEAVAALTDYLVRESLDETNPGDWRGLKAWLPTTDADMPLFGVDRSVPPHLFRDRTTEEKAADGIERGLRKLAFPDLTYAPEALRDAVDALHWQEGAGENYEAYYQAAWALRRLIEER